MTNPQAAANTPRTAAGRALVHDLVVHVTNLAPIEADAMRVATTTAILAIEAEAAAPTPAERREALRELSRDADDLGIYVEPLTSGSCGCKPYSPCDRHQAEFDARLIPEPEGLDVNVLAQAYHNAEHSHSISHVEPDRSDRMTAKRMADEYTRLMRERQP